MTTLFRLLALRFACAYLSACGSGGDAPADRVIVAQTPRPNIVLILADDLGFADLGYNGSEIPTPNIDRLASEGMMLTNFHAGMTCSPTRAMLMSGIDSHLSGLGVMNGPSRPEHVGKPGYLGYLNFRVASLADLLSDAGYDTYISGKWHLGMDVVNGPVARGFRKAFVSLDGAAHLGPWGWRGPQPANYRDGEEIVHVGDDFYSTRVYTERMIRYIDEDRRSDRPFFAYLAYTAPHWPLQAPDGSIARFRGRYDGGYEQVYLQRFANLKRLGLVPPDAEPMDLDTFSPRWEALDDEEKALASRRMEVYAAMVSDLDSYVGRFVAYLKEIGEYDNTFILFLSDNGAEASRRDLKPPIVEHVGKAYDQRLENLGRPNSYVTYGPNWAAASAAPFRGHKFTGFEGGIHVPALVRFPGIVKKSTTSDAFLDVRDVLPTFLELAGTAHPGERYRGKPVHRVQGRSFLPLLVGEATAVHQPDEIAGWELWGHRSVRQGRWKIVWDADQGDAARWMLFDLEDDFGERNDLSREMPEQLATMRTAWAHYEEQNEVIYFKKR
jgi:arylsulfatase A-like enzyme